jgi:predicted nucleic acid-binding protein
VNILFDTNILMDVLLDRAPFSRESSLCVNQVEESAIHGFLCANSVTTIAYLIQKVKNKRAATKQIRTILSLFEIAPVTRAVLEDALSDQYSDFEDAVIANAAYSVKADGILTRNPKDFRKAKVRIYSPAELLTALGIE